MTWEEINPHMGVAPDVMVLRSQYAPTISPEEETFDPNIYQTWDEHCSLTSGGAPLPVVLATLTNVKYWVWAPPAPLTPEENARAKRIAIESSFAGDIESEIDEWVGHGDDDQLRDTINDLIDTYFNKVSQP